MPELSTIIGDKLEITGPVGAREFNVTDYADGALAAAQAVDDLEDRIYGIPSQSVLHLYVDPTAGNDANDGLSSATPVLTGARLWQVMLGEQVPYRVACPVLVHLASGLLNLDSDPVPANLCDRIVAFYADPAWDPRGDLFTVADSGVAGVGTDTANLVAAASFTANARRGLTLEITSGAATGQRRTINESPTAAASTTTYRLCTTVTGLAAGAGYRVLQNNARVQATLLALDGGRGVAATNTSPGVALIGVDLETATNAGDNFVWFVGARLRAGILQINDSCVNAGANLAALDAQFGFTAVSLWTGCGLTLIASASSQVQSGNSGTFNGVLVIGPSGLIGTGGRWTLNGGYAPRFSAGQLNLMLATLQGSAASPFIVGPDGAFTVSPLNVPNGIVNIFGAVLLRGSHATLPLADVSRNGLLIVNATTTGENAGAGPTTRVRSCGKIVIAGAAVWNLGKAAGNDHVCESAAVNKSFFTTANAYHFDATRPGACMARES